MAVVTWPLSSGEARGRVGGLIYNTWRGRSYVKSYKLPKTEFSDPQIDARGITANLTARWQAISDQKRATWAQFAADHPLPSWTGSPKRLSGYNWYVKTNWHLFFDQTTTIDDPPKDIPFYMFRNTSALFQFGILVVSWDPQSIYPDFSQYIIARLEGPHSPAITPSIKRAGRFLQTYEFVGWTALSIPTPGFYTAHFRWTSDRGGDMPPQHFTLDCT